MYCPNCRATLADGSTFCTNCGTHLAPTGAPAPAAAPVYGGAAYSAPRPAGPFRNSNWDGSVLDTFVNSLVASIIIMCTFGLGTPWALCYMFRFITSHAIVDGKRLRFDGDGASLFGNYFVWMLLTVVTCGIYSFWVAPKLYKWIVSNIHFDE